MLNAEKKTEEMVSQAVEHFTATVTAALEQALKQVANSEVRQPESPVRTARGTGDHAEAAKEAVRRAGTTVAPKPAPLPQPRNLKDKIEQTLRVQSLDAQQIARAVDASAGRVSEVMKALRAEGKVVNVGTDVHPIWTLKIGNETSTAELTAFVKRLLMERPMTTRELSEVTGATYSRCGGAVVALQRDPKNQIVDMSTRGLACRWFIIPEGVRDARLEPKKAKPKNGSSPSS